jgi:hypothetical protein
MCQSRDDYQQDPPVLRAESDAGPELGRTLRGRDESSDAGSSQESQEISQGFHVRIEHMTRTVRHIILPALAPATFFWVAFTPVEVLGCFNRGLMALAVAMVSVIGGLIFAVKGSLGRRRGDPNAHWCVLSALILAIPPAALLVLA